MKIHRDKFCDLQGPSWTLSVETHLKVVVIEMYTIRVLELPNAIPISLSEHFFLEFHFAN